MSVRRLIPYKVGVAYGGGTARAFLSNGRIMSPLMIFSTLDVGRCPRVHFSTYMQTNRGRYQSGQAPSGITRQGGRTLLTLRLVSRYYLHE